jgi:hypothetical protein
MPWVGFETTIPASERAKIVHALDRPATVAGSFWFGVLNFHPSFLLFYCRIILCSEWFTVAGRGKWPELHIVFVC